MKFTNIMALLFVGAVLTVVGDAFLKKSNGLQNLSQFSIGLLIYALVAAPIALAFKYIEFSIVFLIWEALNVCIAVLAGYFYFHESFTVLKTLALISALATMTLSYFANKV